MQTNVYLQGELGARFGNKFTVNTTSYREVFRCINANRPDFLPFLRECEQKEIGFIVETAGEQLENEDLLVPVKKGDITVSIAPAGSKSGLGKIVFAAVLVFFVLPMIGQSILATTIPSGGISATVAAAQGQGAIAAALTTKSGLAVAALATNVALAGVQQIMAPDPAVDNSNPTNYLFNGATENAVEGDPMPILYGELRIPGNPISMEFIQGQVGATNNVSISEEGSLIWVTSNVETL